MTKINTKEQIVKTFLALGTVNNIQIFNAKKEYAVEKAIDRVIELDDMLSAFKSDSEISRISRNSGIGFQKVHEDTYQLIRKAVLFSEISNGAFDITIRPLVKLWGINKKGDFVPFDFEIEETLELVNFNDIKFDSKTKSIALKKAGQSLDLGGIAKGFAADEVKRILKKEGIKSALINLGGNIVTIGKRPDGKPWQIGIQNPLAPTGEYLGVLTVTDKTIVTSGSNERFFIKDGVRYHHIIDPRTGKPSGSSLLSVTVICDCSADADALTTAIFILGMEKGLPLLKQCNAEAIFVNEDLTVCVTPGIMDKFEFKSMTQEVENEEQ